MIPCLRGIMLRAALVSLVVSGCDGSGWKPGGLAGGDESTNGFAILLTTTSGPNHVRQAGYIKQSLETAQWRDVFIVTKANHSEVFWGTYSTIQSAQSDLKKAKGFQNRAGRQPFARALLVPLPGKDVGPPEWNLLNASGAYTVQMAAYYDIPDQNYFGRKRSAVQLCQKYRKLGYQAYYYHGPVRSHVTIGTFDKSAIATIRRGRNVQKEIRDPRIHAIIREFPQFNVNGNAHVIFVAVKVPGTKFGERKRVVVKPFPVEIPRKEGQHVPAADSGSGNW